MAHWALDVLRPPNPKGLQTFFVGADSANHAVIPTPDMQ